MKHCVDCKHFSREKEVTLWPFYQFVQLCRHPKTANPVSGEPSYWGAGWHRKEDGACGPKAKLWEPKD